MKHAWRSLLQVLTRSADAQVMSDGSPQGVPADYRRFRQPVFRGLVGLATVIAVAFTFLVRGVSPGLLVGAWSVAAVGMAGWRFHRRDVAPIALYALVVTGLFGGPESEPIALAAMVALSVTIVVFTTRNVALAVATVTAISFVSPLWWRVPDGIVLALAGGIAVAVATTLVAVVTSELIRMAQTTEALFEHAPVAIMEQDWSATLAALDELGRRGVTDMAGYLRSNPDEIGRLLSTVRDVAANHEAAKVMAEAGPSRDRAIADETAFEGNLALLVDMATGRLVRRAVVYPLIDGDGEVRWHLFNSFPHPAGRGRFIIAGADITELTEAKEALETLHASKDRFIAAISHELRTPLAAVVGFSSELIDRPEVMTVAERDEVLRVVKDQATAAADIIADLLVAARADIGGVAVTHDAVDVESEIGRILAGQNEQVTVSGGEALPAVCADAGRVQQVLRNLLTNAIRYGGPERRVLCATTGDRVSIEVRDDGQDLNGIHLDALFEPYARAHESAGITESVGLGLTVSRQLAYAMNGTLTAFRDGHETVFRLELPVWGRCATNDSRQSAAV